MSHQFDLYTSIPLVLNDPTFKLPILMYLLEYMRIPIVSWPNEDVVLRAPVILGCEFIWFTPIVKYEFGRPLPPSRSPVVLQYP